MQKNEKKVLQGFPNKSRDKLKQRVKSFYDILTGIHGADKLILKAIKLEALSLMRSKQIEKRVLGLQNYFRGSDFGKSPFYIRASFYPGST